MEIKEFLGNKIAIYKWSPKTDIKGVVQIAHGVSEHMGRYDEFAGYLNSLGFLVVGNDHWGHGNSSKNYTLNMPPMDFIVETTLNIGKELKEKYPEHPLILFGHSMGSFIALRANELSKDYDALILSGSNGSFPGILRGTMKIISRFLGKSNPKDSSILKLMFKSYNFSFKGKSDYRWLNRNESEVAKYEEDPLCGINMSTAFMKSFINSLILWYRKDEMRKVKSDLPIFIVSGSEDPVGLKGKGVLKLNRELMEAGVKDVNVKLYPGARHEILFEFEKRKTMEDIGNFILNNI